MSNKPLNLTDSKAKQLFHDKFRTAKNRSTAVDEARAWLPPNVYPEIIEWINRTQNSEGVTHPYFPRIAQLGAWGPLKRVNNRREIDWATAIILACKNQIRFFLESRIDFQNAILSSNLSKADEILNSIEQNVGASYWLLKHKVALLQLRDGLNAQKKYANKIKNQYSRWSIRAFIVHQISIRNEPSVTPLRFLQQAFQIIDSWPFSNDWKDMAKYHVTGGLPISIDRAIGILPHSHSESVIDLYEAILYVYRCALVMDSPTHEKEVINKSLKKLYSQFNDSRLSSILFLSTKGSEGKALYGLGEHVQSAQNGHSDLSYFLTNALNENYKSDSTVLSEKITEYLSKIINKKFDTEGYANELDKIAVSFAGFEVLEGLQALCMRELWPDRRLFLDSIDQASRDEQAEIDKKFLFNGAFNATYHPTLQRYYDKEVGSQLEQINPDGIIDVSELNGSQQTISGLECDVEKCIRSIKSSTFDEDFDLSIIKLLNEDGPYHSIGFRLYLIGLIKQNKISQLVSSYVSAYIESQSNKYLFPVKDIANRIDKQLKKDLGNSPILPILFDIYTRNVDGGYDSALRATVAEFLRRNNTKKPSELQSISTQCKHNELVYFLRYCAIPENIYMTGAFSGTEDLLEERLKVLEWLERLDPQNLEVYHSEKIDRTRRIVLETRRVQVEESKIELNLEGFTKEAEKTIREGYDRFLDFRTLHTEEKTDGLNVQQENTSTPQLPDAIPEDEASALFNDIIRGLLAIFVKDRYYGLDGFLSTRIRHNVLESELRSPLVTSNLITTKDPLGNYKFNKVWLEEFSYQNPDLANKLNTYLVEFSRSYDEYLNILKNDWVRVRTNPNEIGKINLILDPSSFQVLESLVTRWEIPFSDFIHSVHQAFVSNLEQGLSEIRKEISIVAKGRGLELLDELEKKLQKEIGTPLGLLNEVRAARGGIQRAFDRVAEWFKLTYEISSEPLKVSDILQISIDITKRFNPNFEAFLELEDQSDCLVHAVLVNSYADLFLMLFENVLSRAGLGEQPIATVKVTTNGDLIRVSVLNEIGEDVDILELNSRIGKIVETIARETYKDPARGERGSGIYRIYDSIKNVLRVEPQLALAVESSRFQISFNLPTTLRIDEYSIDRG